MFARFRLPNGEVNVNVSLVRDFEPGTEEGTSKINFLGGDSRVVPVSNQSVRHAFKKAMTEHQRNYPDDPKSAEG
jgi:hypothetical protein